MFILFMFSVMAGTLLQGKLWHCTVSREGRESRPACEPRWPAGCVCALRLLARASPALAAESHIRGICSCCESRVPALCHSLIHLMLLPYDTSTRNVSLT